MTTLLPLPNSLAGPPTLVPHGVGICKFDDLSFSLATLDRASQKLRFSGARLRHSSPKKNRKRLLRPFARKLVVVAEVGGTLAEIAPVIGPSVKGTLKALSQVLAIVETHYQNQDSIAHLREKLQSFEERLVDHCPTSENAALLVRRLASTQRILEELLSASSLDHDHVASAIAQCERDVSFFLDEFSAVGHIETRALVQQKNDDLTNRVASLESHLSQQGMQMASQSEQMALLISMMASLASQTLPAPTLLSTRIWVVDPFGAKHLFAQVPSSYEVLGRELLERYSMDRFRGPILERYVNCNLLEVSMDDDRKVAVVSEKELGSLDSDSTVVISVVMFSTRPVGQVACPLCKGVIVGYTDAERVLCQTCERSVQISQDIQDMGDVQRIPRFEDDFACLQQIVVNIVNTATDTSTEYQREAKLDKSRSLESLASPGDTWPLQYDTGPPSRARLTSSNLLPTDPYYTGPLSLHDGLARYYSIIEPHLTLGNHARVDLPNNHLRILNTVQIQFLRRLLPQDKGCGEATLFIKTGVTPIRYKRLLLALWGARNALGLPEEHYSHKAYRDALLGYHEGKGSCIKETEMALRKLPDFPFEMGVGRIRMRSITGVDTVIEDVRASCKRYLLKGVHSKITR